MMLPVDFLWLIVSVIIIIVTKAPSWSVAVSTRCFQCSRSWVYFHPELRPMLRGWRSASRVRNLVRRGRPGGRLQALGSPLMETLSALVMSGDVSILATCPKHRAVWPGWAEIAGAMNRLGVLPWRWLRGPCMECEGYDANTMLSKASTLSCKARVRAHVSEPYNKTGWI